MNKYLMEFIGTFFLVIAVAMGGALNVFAAAAALTVAIYIGAHISGGHFNPAVSLGVFMQKKLSPADLAGYWISQIAGGVAAAAVAFALSTSNTKFLTGAAEGVSWGRAAIAEAIFTFLLVFTVLQVALPKKVEGNQYFALAIGLTVIVGGLSIGSISGGALNPAVGIGPLLFDIANIGDHMSNISMYIVGPMVGGAIASVVHTVVQAEG